MRNEEIIFNNILHKCYENNYSSYEIELVKKSYEYAKKVHEGRKRKNGDDFIIHPLTTAEIVANLNSDVTTIVSAMVHEAIQHGNGNLEEIEEGFGTEVKNIVDSLLKVNKLHLVDDSESSALYLRKVLVALSEDVRVIIVKLASRIHNLRTIEGMSPEEGKAKARETWNVLIPIAHRLGINQIKSELEDLSFRILKPDIYDEIESGPAQERQRLRPSHSPGHHSRVGAEGTVWAGAFPGDGRTGPGCIRPPGTGGPALRRNGRFPGPGRLHTSHDVGPGGR